MLPALRRAWRERGAPPAALVEWETLAKPVTSSMLDDFWSVSGDRDYEALGPIHFTAIDALARRRGITDPDDFRRFERLIREMDAVWIADAVERREIAVKEAEAAAKRRG